MPIAIAPSRMADEVRRGLQSTPRTLPSKYFYDDRGSELFERITTLPEYYQTRTEEAILAAVAADIVGRTGATELVELGAGSGRKISALIEAARSRGLPVKLTLFDINVRFAAASARALMERYPGLHALPVTGDFTSDLTALGPGGNRLAILFGGTIGNLHPSEVPGFLRQLAAQLHPGDHFLVGVDTVKSPERLEAAYNDSQGITAEFNLNVLAHINRELGGDFDLTAFRHLAFWSQACSWIEMRLVATRHSRVRVEGAWLDLQFREGEEIRTEISCKYTPASFARCIAGAPFRIERWYTDAEGLFALALLVRTA